MKLFHVGKVTGLNTKPCLDILITVWKCRLFGTGSDGRAVSFLREEKCRSARVSSRNGGDSIREY